MFERKCKHCDKLALYLPLMMRGKQATGLWSTSNKGVYCLSHATQVAAGEDIT